MKKQTTNRMTNKQNGLTLVELMVAMIISLLLIGGTISIFISNKQTYRVNEASSRVQENSRFSFDFLTNDVRMAGFFGCVSNILDNTNLNNIVDETKYTGGAGTSEPNIKKLIGNFDGTNSLKGYTLGTTLTNGDLFDYGLVIGTATENALPNQDVIAVQIGESCDKGAVVLDMTSTTVDITIKNAAACNLQVGSVALISDCTSANLFRVTKITANAPNDELEFASTSNSPSNLSKAYKQDANVYALRSTIYYIGNGSSGEPALFRRVFSGTAGTMINEELVEDIESMAITYGVDTDDDKSANYYVRAVNVSASDWAKVTSARITLVSVSALKNIVQSGDKKLRHTFIETIKIRNR